MTDLEEIDALRVELRVLGQLTFIASEGRIPAKEHELARDVLNWLKAKTDPAEARLTELLALQPKVEPEVVRVNAEATA